MTEFELKYFNKINSMLYMQNINKTFCTNDINAVFFKMFIDNSKAYISTQTLFANVCPGGPESSPAGYSELDIDCIKGCARNYRCHFGSYSLLGNNCHHFTNEISKVLCTSGQSCPAWCLDDCNHAVETN